MQIHERAPQASGSLTWSPTWSQSSLDNLCVVVAAAGGVRRTRSSRSLSGRVPTWSLARTRPDSTTGVAREDLMTVDELHCMHLGVFQSLVTHAMKQLIDSNVGDVGEKLPTDDLHHHGRLRSSSSQISGTKMKASRSDAPAPRAEWLVHPRLWQTQHTRAHCERKQRNRGRQLNSLTTRCKSTTTA